MFTIWLDYAMLLLQGSSVVITTALLLFGIPALRRQLLFQDRSFYKQLFIILLFSVFAIYGTHAGKIVSPSGGLEAVIWSHEVKQNEAVMNFRDMVVITAGLAAGPWVGITVGSIAGLERYSLGGFTAYACGFASFMSGLLAGLFRQRIKSMVKPYQAAIIGASSVSVQMFLILILAKPFSAALLLVQQTAIPMIITVVIGCYGFQQVLRVFDKVRLKLESEKIKVRAQRAEIRALNAQIEPHFLMNNLTGIRALIHTDQNKASDYVSLLGEFLHEIRDYATHDTISIKNELSHVKKYLKLYELRRSTEIDYNIKNEHTNLLNYKIPPRLLLTIIENSLNYGFTSDSNRKSICIEVSKNNNNLIISVEDNGVGISKQKIQEIENNTVNSSRKYGGKGLFYLRTILKELYGELSQMKINSLPDHKGTIVSLILPLKLESEG